MNGAKDSKLDDDSRFIGYCEIHCQTERALFHARDINRMIVLAGSPVKPLTGFQADGFHSMHESMAELCQLARERQKKLNSPPPDNIVSLDEYRQKTRLTVS